MYFIWSLVTQVVIYSSNFRFYLTDMFILFRLRVGWLEYSWAGRRETAGLSAPRGSITRGTTPTPERSTHKSKVGQTTCFNTYAYFGTSYHKLICSYIAVRAFEMISNGQMLLNCQQKRKLQATSLFFYSLICI